jgi:hypothetical protein
MELNTNIQEKRTGFKVPKDYFESLDTTISKRIQNQSVSKKTGFKVPENYFDEFTVNLPQPQSAPKVIPINEWAKWVVAASIMAFAILGALYIDSISPKQDIQISDLDNEMIEDYLEFHLENPDEFIDSNSLSLDQMINDNLVNLENQDILNYLNDKIEDQDFEDE